MPGAIDHWLQGIGLSKYSALFAENEIGLDVLPDLTDADLEKLSIPLGDRKRLLKAVAYLSERPEEPVAPEASPAKSPEAEELRNNLALVSQVKTAIDVVVYIIENNPDISHVTFAKYPMKAAPSPIDNLKCLEETLLHHKENEDYPPIERIAVTWEKLFQMCKELSIGKCLAVRSKVKTSSDKILYIPLLDFVLKKGDENLLLLVNLMSKVRDCEKLEKEGFLLETTHSYHYYGASLLKIEDWIKFIGRCLLLHPRPEDFETAMQLGVSAVIDARFLGHSLLAGQGSLRVSADCQGDFPRVVATIEPGRQ